MARHSDSLRLFRELITRLSPTPVPRSMLMTEIGVGWYWLESAREYWLSQNVAIQTTARGRKIYLYVDEKDWPHVEKVAEEAWEKLEEGK